MTSRLKLSFSDFDSEVARHAVVFVGPELKLGAEASRRWPALAPALTRAAEIDGFKGKLLTSFVMVAPAETGLDRVTVVGLGDANERTKLSHVNLGGHVAGRITTGKAASVVLEMAGEEPPSARQAADVALGMHLRDYAFDRYKTKSKDGEGAADAIRVTLHVGNASGARKAWKPALAVGEGVHLARDLVNEPPNVLTPTAFADRAGALESLGVEIETLDVKAMRKLGMRALLGVAQGSEQEPRVVIMRWKGASDPAQAPVALVGKGVCFDSGGISIKPAQGMEDMKGDMAGAAAVVGAMHAIAARKAQANVVGIIGLVENMPDGRAQRPGDIVKSMSGQTIEIINTDAEGRLVLADIISHVQATDKPRLIVDLATLTGAILVALAQEFAGLFSNNDELAERLSRAGEATGERVWRLPLTPEFDKMIDSKFADMKNTGGRNGGSITAAQFIQRFVNDTPWAHLDIAGVAMGSPQSETSRAWGSGWGVRLLDRLIADHYEG
jgi:leucyl aminopeptidase